MTRLLSAQAVRVVAVSAALSMIAALSATAPAEAGKPKKKTRTVSKTYAGATGLRGVQDSPCVAEPVGCVRFPIEPGEKFVSIEVTDASGEDVWASVYVYGYSDGTDAHEHVCGKGDSPFRIASGLEEVVVVTTQTTGGATNPCAGVATQGTITAVFSNR